jgi:hypothetical protein
MKSRSKSKTKPLRQEKHADRFLESPWVPCCQNALSEGFIQCPVVHQWKLGSRGGEILPGWVECTAKKLVVHIDNTLPQLKGIQSSFRRNRVKRLPHHPHPPDISPSDFYLFGKVKSALTAREIPDEINLLEVVTEILNSISGPEFPHVF